MAAIAALTFGSIRTVAEKNAPAHRPGELGGVGGRFCPGHQRRGAPGSAGGGSRRGRERCGAPGRRPRTPRSWWRRSQVPPAAC